MKFNKLLIAIIIIILASTFILFGCEKQKIKNEIIQFDKEYWEIAEGYLLEVKTFGEGYSKIVKNDPDTMEIEIKTIEKVIKLQEDYISYYSNYIKTFRGFHIPEPLDEFYYKKLEQFDNALKSDITWLNAQNEKKDALELYNLTTGVGLIKESVETYKQLLEECEDYNDRVFSLGLECDKLRREVYREYGLEDLLDKWQQ